MAELGGIMESFDEVTEVHGIDGEVKRIFIPEPCTVNFGLQIQRDVEDNLALSLESIDIPLDIEEEQNICATFRVFKDVDVVKALKGYGTEQFRLNIYMYTSTGEVIPGKGWVSTDCVIYKIVSDRLSYSGYCTALAEFSGHFYKN
jgi:hypothetical protein